MPSRVVLGELVGDPPGARAALERPYQRLLPRSRDRLVVHAEVAKPRCHDRQVLRLAERIEADPQAEPLGQRDLLLDHLARMHLAVLGVLVREVFLHVLGQQVAPVARGIDEHVVGGLRHRAVEDRLQRLVARLALVEAQVVAEDDEVLRTLGHQVDDVGQIDEVGLVDLDEAQPAAAQLVEAGLDERALARAARTRQQHVVRAVPLHELQRVAQQAFLLRLDLAQVGQARLACGSETPPTPTSRVRRADAAEPPRGAPSAPPRARAGNRDRPWAGIIAASTARPSGGDQATIRRSAASRCSVGVRLKPERA